MTATAADPRRDRKPFRVRRQDLRPDECLCDHCTAKCCRYFSLAISTPSTWDDYDEIRWYLAHGQTIVYVDKRTWYLLVMTRCKYLRRDNLCGIYADRPKVCREYTTADCEYDTDWTFEKVFEAPEQIWEYAEATLPPRRRRPRAEAPPPPVLVTIGASLPPPRPNER